MKVSFLIAELQRMQRLSGDEDLEVKIKQEDGWHDLLANVYIERDWEEDDMDAAVVLTSLFGCHHSPDYTCAYCCIEATERI